MPQNNVADLVCHHSRNLILRIGSLNGSTIHIDETARQSECIDCSIIHDLELIWVLFTRRMGGQLFSKRVNVAGGLPVIENRQLHFSLFRGFPPHLDILLRREQIPARLQFRPAVRGICGNHERDNQPRYRDEFGVFRNHTFTAPSGQKKALQVVDESSRRI